jgi:hypothetical protein
MARVRNHTRSAVVSTTSGGRSASGVHAASAERTASGDDDIGVDCIAFILRSRCSNGNRLLGACLNTTERRSVLSLG